MKHTLRTNSEDSSLTILWCVFFLSLFGSDTEEGTCPLRLHDLNAFRCVLSLSMQRVVISYIILSPEEVSKRADVFINKDGCIDV